MVLFMMGYFQYFDGYMYQFEFMFRVYNEFVVNGNGVVNGYYYYFYDFQFFVGVFVFVFLEEFVFLESMIKFLDFYVDNFVIVLGVKDSEEIVVVVVGYVVNGNIQDGFEFIIVWIQEI